MNTPRRSGSATSTRPTTIRLRTRWSRRPGGSIYGRAQVHPDRNNFAPRVGFAYNVTPKTVIRSAYGISYVHFNRMGSENLLAENGPFFVRVTISQLTSQPLCTANAAPTTCFRPTEMGYPSRSDGPEELRRVRVQEHLQSGRHAHVLRAELALHHPAGTGARPDSGCRVRGQSRQQAADPRRLQPGASQPAPARTSPSRSAVPIPTSTCCRSTTTEAGRTITRYRSSWKSVTPVDSTCSTPLRGRRRWTTLPATWKPRTETTRASTTSTCAATRAVSGYNQPLNDTATVIWELPFGRQPALRQPP